MNEPVTIKKRKIWKHGDSYATVIPKQLIDNDIINIDKEHDITIKESQHNKEKNREKEETT
jgi:hypothetical protein